MSDFHLYDTKVTWKEDRIGILSEPTLPSIEVATPPEFPKGVPNIWSPEHLYVASANVCLMTTFLAIAENSKIEVVSYSCNGTGKLEKVEGRFMMSEITLKPVIKIKNEADLEKVSKLILKAESACLISNSMKTVVHLEPEITAG